MMKKNFSKTSIMMFVCIAALFFTACSKDDDNGFSDYSIVGLWSFIDADVEIYVNDKDFVSYMVGQGVPKEFANEVYDEFKAEFEVAEFGDIEFKADGTFIGTAPDDDETYTGEWSVNDNNTELTLTEGVDVSTFEITKLTETELHIAISESEKEDVNEDGKMDTVTIEMVFSLEK